MQRLNLRRFLRRRLLLVGLLAVIVPLAVLLGLQYRWLASLEKTSAIAEKAWLSSYLEAVDSEIEYYYRKQAERALNVPASIFSTSKVEKIAHYLAKKKVEAARCLFVAKFPSGHWKGLHTFDPSSGAIDRSDDPATQRAIMVALSPWKTLASKGAESVADTLVVEEQDPDNRIVLKPILEEGHGLIGVAGMVVDTKHFRKKVLPAAVKKMFSKFFDERSRNNLIIEVRDGTGRLVQGSEIEVKETRQVAQRMSFIFSDWKIALGSRYTTPEEWAKSNFILNVTMSVLLAVVLLGGVILALRTASREMKLSAMKSDFVSNVSHELRTPLASIRVFGEFLRLGRVRQESKTREYGEYIETESRRLTQLINNILDFSKIESGAKTYQFEPSDLQEVVAETLRTLNVSLRHRGFQLDFVTPPEPLPALKLDPDAMAQAVANLVDNAVKYSDSSKQVTVTIERAGDEVAVHVKDRGIGISADEQDKIFERFHRVSTGLIHDVKGSGLGLSIVSHIVKAHRGTVTVKSEPGHGSTFTIRLPLARSRARRSGQVFESRGESANPMGGT